MLHPPAPIVAIVVDGAAEVKGGFARLAVVGVLGSGAAVGNGGQQHFLRSKGLKFHVAPLAVVGRKGEVIEVVTIDAEKDFGCGITRHGEGERRLGRIKILGRSLSIVAVAGRGKGVLTFVLPTPDMVPENG